MSVFIPQPKPPVDYSQPIRYEQGHTGSGFRGYITPVIITSLITCLVCLFNLLSDWFTYRVLITMAIPDHVMEMAGNDSSKADEDLWGMKDMFLSIPKICFYFCCIGSALVFIEFVRLLFVFFAQRNSFKEKKDGVPYHETIVETFGEEIMILLLCFFQDISLSAILLSLQAAISCTFLIPLKDDIFFIAILASCISVSWKFFRSVINIKHSRTTDYSKKCYKYLKVCLNIVCVMFTLIGLLIVSLNFSLYISKWSMFSSASLRTSLFDKISIDRWLNADRLCLVNVTHLNNNYEYANLTDLYHVRNIIYSNSMKYKTMPCRDQHFAMDTFLQKEHHNKMKNHNYNCTMVFAFAFDRTTMTLAYNLRYRIELGDRYCESGSFEKHNGLFTMPRGPEEQDMTSYYDVMLYSDMSDDADTACPLVVRYNDTRLQFDPCQGYS